MITIVFAMSGSVRRNSRALKQIRLLSEFGFRTIVFDIKANESFPDPDIENTEWHHLDVSGKGPRFFRDIHRSFLKACKNLKADVYHASDLYVLAALRKAAAQNDAKLVYDSRELYPHVAATKNKVWATLFWSSFEAKNIKPVDLVFTVSRSIADALNNLYPDKNPIVLWNIPAKSQSVISDRSIFEDLNLDSNTHLILHQGQIKRSRGCDKLVESMKDIRSDAHCAFLGGGPFKSELQKLVKENNLSERVHFLDPVPSDQVINYVKGASLGLTLLEDTCLNHRFALPNKLFEYLKSELPVLASDLPEMATIVQDYDVGQVTNASSPEAIASSVNSMLADPKKLKEYSQNASSIFIEMNWEIASERFKSAYQSLLSDSRV